MKKVTLLLPDKLIYVKGSSGHAEKIRVETTPENIVKALTLDDYHMNYYFDDPQAITVLKIETEK